MKVKLILGGLEHPLAKTGGICAFTTRTRGLGVLLVYLDFCQAKN
jgi:hypothetical protein